jgi:hypothetical protein
MLMPSDQGRHVTADGMIWPPPSLPTEPL